MPTPRETPRTRVLDLGDAVVFDVASEAVVDILAGRSVEPLE